MSEEINLYPRRVLVTAAMIVAAAPFSMISCVNAQSSKTSAQTAGEVLGPAAVVPLAEPQPPAKIIVDPPLAEPLSRGYVFIQYRAVNLRIVPVFGPKALEVTPRIGHIHVVVDGAPWHWADASGEPLILVGLPPGPHKVEVILANPNHQPLDRATVEFVVPEQAAAKSH